MASNIATVNNQFYLNDILYTGSYCIGPSGAIYTGLYFNPLYSKILSSKRILLFQQYGTYELIIPLPTRLDYNNGFMYRYFAKNVLNTNIVDIILINKIQYLTLNIPIYNTF